MFRHVLCIYPYRWDLKNTNFIPPLGLECIAAAIEPSAQTIDVVDIRKETGRTKDFLRPETDMVCFSVNWDSDDKFIREEILSIGPGKFVVVGGRHATEDPELWLTQCPNVSVVVRGDGEEMMEDICKGIALEKITGISFRRDGQIIHNPNREPGHIKEDIYPNRCRRRYDYTVSLGGFNTGLMIDIISSSRGCPFNCTFCSFSRNPWGGKRSWSARSPESVVKEINQVKAPFIIFTDDLFTLKMDRVEKICDMILAQGIRKKYIINARLEIARYPQIIKKMEKAGFLFLLLGIESACDKTLSSMGKGFNTAQIREYFKVLRNSSMFLHGYYILGNIGESVDEMLKIPDFSHELGLDTLGISTLRVLPHSHLEELVANSPGYHIAPNGKVYSDNCSPQMLRQLRRRIYKKFHSPKQNLRLLHKGIRNGALLLLPGLFLKLPKIIWDMARHKHKHKQSMDI
jgi:anaerobic magnesium-protoporphyrin IX monomethyl ester cyclase